MQLLLSVGADINHVTNSKWSPLCFASSNGNLELVQLLINNGAIYTKHSNLKSLFLSSRVDLPINNDTPLQIAQKRAILIL